MSETLDDRIRAYARANRLTIQAARNRLLALGLATALGTDPQSTSFVETIDIGIDLALATFEARYGQAVASLRNVTRSRPTPPTKRRTGRAEVVQLDTVRAAAR